MSLKEDLLNISLIFWKDESEATLGQFLMIFSMIFGTSFFSNNFFKIFGQNATCQNIPPQKYVFVVILLFVLIYYITKGKFPLYNSVSMKYYRLLFWNVSLTILSLASLYSISNYFFDNYIRSVSPLLVLALSSFPLLALIPKTIERSYELGLKQHDFLKSNTKINSIARLTILSTFSIILLTFILTYYFILPIGSIYDCLARTYSGPI